jgi:hypothetical protein
MAAASIEKYIGDIDKERQALIYFDYVQKNKTHKLLKIKDLQPLPANPEERIKIKVDLDNFPPAAKHFMCWAVLYGSRNDRIILGSLNFFVEEIEAYWGKLHSRTSLFNALQELEKADLIETLYKNKNGSCYLLKV